MTAAAIAVVVLLAFVGLVLLGMVVGRHLRAAREYDEQWAAESWKRVPPRRSHRERARQRAADALARKFTTTRGA